MLKAFAAIVAAAVVAGGITIRRRLATLSRAPCPARRRGHHDVQAASLALS